jgi:hypothetical protein
VLGVVEYLDDPFAVLSRLSRYARRVIVTYSTTELHPTRYHLWLNGYSEEDFLDLLHLSGYAVKMTSLIEDHRQILVVAESANLLPFADLRKAASRLAVRAMSAIRGRANDVAASQS